MVRSTAASYGLDDDDAEDEEDEGGGGNRRVTVPSADSGEESSVDRSVSLFGDSSLVGVPIEPFNMDAERYGGGGFFDASGAYVFRRERGEEDAWLESLGEGGGGGGGC